MNTVSLMKQLELLKIVWSAWNQQISSLVIRVYQIMPNWKVSQLMKLLSSLGRFKNIQT